MDVSLLFLSDNNGCMNGCVIVVLSDNNGCMYGCVIVVFE